MNYKSYLITRLIIKIDINSFSNGAVKDNGGVENIDQNCSNALFTNRSEVSFILQLIIILHYLVSLNTVVVSILMICIGLEFAEQLMLMPW